MNQESREKQNAITQKFNKMRSEDRKNKQLYQNTKKKEGNERRKISNDARATTRALGNLSYNFRNSVIGETKKPLKLPHDYQYNDAEPESVINPLTPFGDKITVAEGESRIEAYGRWMTSTTNPRFTKTIANRLWKRVMGIGLFEPVDNIKEDTEATNPELLAHLEKLLVDLDYDIKAYYRILYNTKTYQREAQSADLLANYYYPGPRLRRMSAEQIWDSLLTLVRPDVDTATDPRAPQYSKNRTRLEAWDRINAESPEALLDRQKELAEFTDSTKEQLDQMREKVEKAIAKKNQKQAIDLSSQLLKFNSDATKEYARLTYWDLESFGNRYFQTPVPQRAADALPPAQDRLPGGWPEQGSRVPRRRQHRHHGGVGAAQGQAARGSQVEATPQGDDQDGVQPDDGRALGQRALQPPGARLGDQQPGTRRPLPAHLRPVGPPADRELR